MSANKIQTLNEAQLNFSQGFQTVQLINGKSDFQIDVSKIEIIGGAEIPDDLLSDKFKERRKAAQKFKAPKPTLTNINILYKGKPFNVLVKKVSKFDKYGYSEDSVTFKYKIHVNMSSTEQNLDKLAVFQRFIQLGIQFKLFQVVFDIKNVNSDKEFLTELREKINQPVDIDEHYGRFLEILENQTIIRKPSKMTTDDPSYEAPTSIETVQDFYLDIIHQVSKICKQLPDKDLSKEQRILKTYFSMACFSNPKKNPYGCTDTISFEEVKYMKNGTLVAFDQYVWTMVFKVFTPEIKKELQKVLLEANMKTVSKDEIKQAFTDGGCTQMFKILNAAISESVKLPGTVHYLTTKKLTDKSSKFFEPCDFEIKKGMSKSNNQTRYFVVAPEMSCIAGAMNSHQLTWIVKEVKFIPLFGKGMSSSFSTSFIPDEDENFEDTNEAFEAESILDEQF